MSAVLTTKMGVIRGNARTDCNEYLGIRYATAGRFEYAKPFDKWEGEYDATRPADSCPQSRGYYEHLDVPERMFYHKEFRDGIKFTYSEDCLNLNIYTPKKAGKYPVIVFIYGGGFNSGSIYEGSFDGGAYAKRDCVFVCISYRVGILGYLTHEDIAKRNGREGNFGLDDQVTALKWVKAHIDDFYGDPDNVTVMGQSAGAISIQYLCLSEEAKGLFKHAVMMSGAGLFPKFSLPRKSEDTREYWLNFMDIVGAKTLDELKTMPLQQIFDGIETIKGQRKDNTYNTMPVIDGYYLTKPIDELIENPMKIDYMVGYTNNDMYAIIMSKIGHAYAKANDAYLYYFDIDAPGGDKNGAFHSSDLRYVFGTLLKSHRPYGPHDYEVSAIMMDYIASFAKTGDPNGLGRPEWIKGGKKALHISPKGISMGKPSKLKLLWNTLTKGDPK